MRRFGCWVLLSPASSVVWPVRGLCWARGALASVGARGGSVLQSRLGACGHVLGWGGAAPVPPARECSRPPAPRRALWWEGIPCSLSGGFRTAGCPADLGQGLLLSTPLLLAARQGEMAVPQGLPPLLVPWESA